MIVLKRALPRRTFLRGLGVTLGLPLLDAMIPAMTALTATPANPMKLRRLGVVYVPMGCASARWTPTSATLEKLSPTLAPLAPLSAQVTAISNLELKGVLPGTHVNATANFLSVDNIALTNLTERSDYYFGATADQIAAQQIGLETRFSSLELSVDGLNTFCKRDNGYACVYQNNLSWSSPTMPILPEAQPRRVFEKLFGDGNKAIPRRVSLEKPTSLLDAVTSEVASLGRQLNIQDRNRIDQYLQAIREVEKRIQQAEASVTDHSLPDLDRPLDAPAAYAEHANLMFDLQWLALQGDLTRVITFQLAAESSQRTYSEIGVPEPHHALTHYGSDPEKIAKVALINRFHVSLFADFLLKLQATPEAGGTLLDHALYLYGSGMGNSHLHDHKNLPILVAGGAASRLRGGCHIRLQDPTPLAKLHLTLLDKVGVRLDKFADSDGQDAGMIELLTI